MSKLLDPNDMEHSPFPTEEPKGWKEPSGILKDSTEKIPNGLFDEGYTINLPASK